MSTQQVQRLDFSIALLQGPTEEPLTLQQAKEHLRLPTDVGFTDFDNKLNVFIKTARGYLERNYGIRCLTQKVEVTFQNFPAEDRIRIPVWPVQSFDYFTYTRADGVTTPMLIGATDTPNVELLTRTRRKPAEICLPWAKIWPPAVLTTADAIRVGLTVGFNPNGSPLTLPLDPNIIQAMCLLLSWWWDNGAAATVGSLMKSDLSALGVDECMSDLRLYW